MPSTGWDGRLNGGNAGGFAGYVNYLDLAAAVRSRQAAVATDTGHRDEGMSGDWAKGRPERVRDYGWRGVHLSTVAAKALLKAFYGRGPDHSYFIGCSNGGRQGLMEAARFPGDYDGIVAGAPAVRLTDVSLSMIATVQAQHAEGAAISPAQVPALQKAVLAQCDALDGEKDGLLQDPRQCDFDPAVLACDNDAAETCFSAAQIAALEHIERGRLAPDGTRLAYGFPASGAEAGKPFPGLGWEGWITGEGGQPPNHAVFPGEMLANFFPEPFATPQDFDFARHVDRYRAHLAGDLDASADLSAFVQRGGKLIIWHGWADVAISPLLAIDYYEEVLRTSGPAAKDAVRLFMIPGAQHCAGGTGYASIGQMSAPSPDATARENLGAAIQAWVEEGRAPDSLVGRKGLPIPGAGGKKVQTGLHCAYPALATRSPGEASSALADWSCRAP